MTSYDGKTVINIVQPAKVLAAVHNTNLRPYTVLINTCVSSRDSVHTPTSEKDIQPLLITDSALIDSRLSIHALLIMMELDEQPKLPLELERMIFEMAVGDIVNNLPPTHCALNFQLTAKRVRYWIRPLLYRIFKQTTKRVDPFPDFSGKSNLDISEIGPFIKHFIYGSSPLQDPEAMTELIRHSPNIENLAIWCSSDSVAKLYPAFSALSNLRSLSARFGGLTRDQIISPFMLRLTHLELVGNLSWDIVVQLKNLTHLSTSVVVYNPYGFLLDPVGHIEHLLEKVCAADGCPNLQVFKIYTGSSLDFHDVRLVLLPLGLFSYEASVWDWLNGANGHFDTWMFADRIVHARQRGYMSPTSDTVFDPFSFDHENMLNEEGRTWWKNQYQNDHRIVENKL